MRLTMEEHERYSRQIALPEIGEKGQVKLKVGKTLVVGVGGLGSPAAFYLAAAGIGTLGIADSDIVEISNLQRQLLHTSADTGLPKTDSAKTRLNALNPETSVITHHCRITPENAENIFKGYDFIIDATDNFSAKFLIAEICHKTNKPYSHAGISKFIGQTITVFPGVTACCRCIFETLSDEPTPGPVQGPLGVVPGVIGTIQAAEAIKHFTGTGTLLANKLLVYDALHAEFRKIPVKQRKDCPLCGTGRSGQATGNRRQ